MGRAINSRSFADGGFRCKISWWSLEEAVADCFLTGGRQVSFIEVLEKFWSRSRNGSCTGHVQAPILVYP